MSAPAAEGAPRSLDEALEKAAIEKGLALYYRSCVRPLLRDPEGRWPTCCGSGCDPCMDLLTAVARRTLVLMGTPRKRED